jgi:transcriptional regulator with XRE-family HTH domain
MDDARVGSIFRAVRIRRGLTQSEVGAAAGCSRPVVSVIERGGMEQTSLRTVRSVARVLGISLSVDARWRGAEAARLLDERHAALVRSVAEALTRLGFEVRVEHTFNIWGERGSIDILAWHPVLRVVLAIEVKTRLVDFQDLLASTDRKRRLLPIICEQEGWAAQAFGSVLALPEESWARHAVRRFAPILDAAFPARTVAVRRWLTEPIGNLRGIWFLSNDRRGSANRRPGGPMRVRPMRIDPPRPPMPPSG